MKQGLFYIFAWNLINYSLVQKRTCFPYALAHSLKHFPVANFIGGICCCSLPGRKLLLLFSLSLHYAALSGKNVIHHTFSRASQSRNLIGIGNTGYCDFRLPEIKGRPQQAIRT
ncbi:hypothetical protein [Parendozoicomonas sp. Alg238-R29]|uniref:hypothetical protein n=1 Tax=Parendozoicomonas sp. Alg238-R29 TaxID=2993446 RepID=UPI00248F38D8|nr:hypothetical protein [Parendozoicomonas sp. Alg238-R29]